MQGPSPLPRLARQARTSPETAGNRSAMTPETFVLKLACPNRPGIVAGVSAFLFEGGCNILEAQQFDDTETGRFFMRVAFNAVAGNPDLAAMRDGFKIVGERFGMEWSMRSTAEKRRVMLLVSKSDHCLVDLLYRRRIGELQMDISAIVANHPRETYSHIDLE